MPYCVSKVKLDPEGRAVAAVWGWMDGVVAHGISEPVLTGASEVAQRLRQGKLVWASFPTPHGLAVGGLCRVCKGPDGRPTFDLVPETSNGRTLRDMQQL